MNGILDGIEVIPAGELADAPTGTKYRHPHKPSKRDKAVVCPPGVGCWHDQCHPVATSATKVPTR